MLKSLYNVLYFILTHPLARLQRIEALKRFFFYQFSKLFNPYPIIYPFTDKSKLIVGKGMTGATGNMYCGLHEFEDMAFLLHFLRPEDLFVDVGANIGSYTVLASGHVGCKTIAFEPIPNTYERLRNNIVINYLTDKVISFNVGVGSKNEELRFTSDLDTGNHVVINDQDKTSIPIPVDSLDNLLPDTCPVLLKIDVEGFETEVLKGAIETLKNQILKAIIIELNGSGTNYGYSDESIHLMLIELGFRPFTYQPFARELKDISTFGKTNTLYLRDLVAINNRLKNAESFQVLGRNV